MTEQCFFFTIDMKYNECMSFYDSNIQNVVVTTDRGKRIQFPKQNLRKFIRPNGIRGRFKLKIDKNNKIIELSLA